MSTDFCVADNDVINTSYGYENKPCFPCKSTKSQNCIQCGSDNKQLAPVTSFLGKQMHFKVNVFRYCKHVDPCDKKVSLLHIIHKSNAALKYSSPLTAFPFTQRTFMAQS